MQFLCDPIRRCRICGCTDITACLHEDGTPCAWMDEDLCSVCADKLAELENELADCLAAAIDTPILKVRNPDGGAEIELRLGSFLPDVCERAAKLLELAGR